MTPALAGATQPYDAAYPSCERTAAVSCCSRYAPQRIAADSAPQASWWWPLAVIRQVWPRAL